MTERRRALKALVVLGGAAYAGVIAVPAAGYLTSPQPGGQRGARWIRIGRLADLPPGKPVRLAVVADERDAFTLQKDQLLGSVWVMREAEGVRALSATCPHLGCAIDLAPDQKGFACPCHASRFALAGGVEAGPSPRGMDALETRIAEGFVEVDFRRFQEGRPDRREVGA